MNIKFVNFCVTQTNSLAGIVFRITAWSPVAFGVELLTFREALIKAGFGSTSTKCKEGVKCKRWLTVKLPSQIPYFYGKRLKDLVGKNKQHKVKICVAIYFAMSWAKFIKWINACVGKNEEWRHEEWSRWWISSDKTGQW